MARILVVENDDSNAEVIKLILCENNHIVVTIQQSNLLNVTLERFCPDLIIMDILLDNQDGRILCHNLKSNLDTHHIPVMLITAMLESHARSIDCGADYLMLKPFDYAILTRKVNALIQ